MDPAARTDASEWTPPSFEEVKMDAEIGSYQPDDRDPGAPPFAANAA
jgi:hypothetical protein